MSGLASTEHKLHDRVRELEAERDALKAEVERLKEELRLGRTHLTMKFKED